MASPKPNFDMEKMKNWIDHDNLELRKEVRVVCAKKSQGLFLKLS